MDIPFDKLKAQYLALPDELKEVISSADNAEILYTIGKTHGLRLDEMDALSKHVGFVLLGITSPDDFVARLRAALPLSPDKIPSLTAAVNKEIFAPVHDAIIGMHKKEGPVKVIPHTLGADMTKAKMDGTFRLSPDTLTVKAPTPVAPAMISKPAPAAPVRDGKYASADPYREPTS